MSIEATPDGPRVVIAPSEGRVFYAALSRALSIGVLNGPARSVLLARRDELRQLDSLARAGEGFSEQEVDDTGGASEVGNEFEGVAIQLASAKQLAASWGVSERRVRQILADPDLGFEIPGRIQIDGRWFAPANTEKPAT